MNKRNETDPVFWGKSTITLREDLEKLRKKRNDISHEGKISNEPIYLLQQAIENTISIARHIDRKVQEDFSLTTVEPQWDKWLVLGKSYFNKVIDNNINEYFENLAKCVPSIRSSIENDFLEITLEKMFRYLIKSYLKRTDKIEKKEKFLKKNLAKRLTDLSNIPDKESLIARNEKLEKELKEIKNEEKELKDKYLAEMSKVSGEIMKHSKTQGAIKEKEKKYEEKIKQYDVQRSRIKLEIENNKKIIDSIIYYTKYYLNERNKILDTWFDDNVNMMIHTKNNSLLENYLNWKGIIEFDDFCNCISDTMGSMYPELIKLASSLISFNQCVLNEQNKINAEKLIIKKLYEFHTIERGEPERVMIKWTILHSCTEETYNVEIDSNHIILAKNDMPEKIGIGINKVMHWCNQDGLIKYEVMK